MCNNQIIRTDYLLFKLVAHSISPTEVYALLVCGENRL